MIIRGCDIFEKESRQQEVDSRQQTVESRKTKTKLVKSFVVEGLQPFVKVDSRQ
jgi:hypothetical protein